MADIPYKCHCMKGEAVIAVPDRRPNTDILIWMELVTFCIQFDHKALSPHCLSNTMQYVKLPIDETTGLVGRSPTKN